MKGIGEAEFLRYLLSPQSPMASSFAQQPAGLPTDAFQPPPMAGAPMPRVAQRAVQQQRPAQPMQPQQPPLSLAAPNPGPGMSFSGQKGPQWTDEQWQNHWGRSSPDGLMSYYPVQE